MTAPSHPSHLPESNLLTECLGGVLLNGAFIPLDFHAIDQAAEADIAAGRIWTLEAVMREMDALLATGDPDAKER